MCGIVGYTGHQPALPLLIAGLRDLEYRGYDSAGVATDHGTSAGAIHVVKRAGKIAMLEDALQGDEHAAYATGIGHTRWATHGKPNDLNAHPHSGPLGRAVVVHNGIVENYSDLRTRLAAQGNTFASETDTEIIAHLVEEALATGSGLLDAVRAASARLDGSQAIVAMDREEPGTLVAARLGNAGGVVVGIGDDEMFVASDLAAVLPTHAAHRLPPRPPLRPRRPGRRLRRGRGRRPGRSGGAAHRASIPMSALKGDYPHSTIEEIHAAAGGPRRHGPEPGQHRARRCPAHGFPSHARPVAVHPARGADRNGHKPARCHGRPELHRAIRGHSRRGR
ncbi:MAG: hypothetical protein U5Q44_09195 [Dehalococcoidia bacterium]|nr:hypothetical protein [Dehalococcoidia bacterium]